MQDFDFKKQQEKKAKLAQLQEELAQLELLRLQKVQKDAQEIRSQIQQNALKIDSDVQKLLKDGQNDNKKEESLANSQMTIKSNKSDYLFNSAATVKNEHNQNNNENQKPVINLEEQKKQKVNGYIKGQAERLIKEGFGGSSTLFLSKEKAESGGGFLARINQEGFIFNTNANKNIIEKKVLVQKEFDDDMNFSKDKVTVSGYEINVRDIIDTIDYEKTAKKWTEGFTNASVTGTTQHQAKRKAIEEIRKPYNEIEGLICDQIDIIVKQAQGILQQEQEKNKKVDIVDIHEALKNKVKDNEYYKQYVKLFPQAVEKKLVEKKLNE